MFTFPKVVGQVFPQEVRHLFERHGLAWLSVDLLNKGVDESDDVHLATMPHAAIAMAAPLAVKHTILRARSDLFRDRCNPETSSPLPASQ